MKPNKYVKMIKDTDSNHAFSECKESAKVRGENILKSCKKQAKISSVKSFRVVVGVGLQDMPLYIHLR